MARGWFFLLVFFSLNFSLSGQEQINPVPLQKRLQEDPEDKNALLQLALYFTMEKNFGKATELYFRLLKIDPKNFHAYNNLGIIYKKVGQFSDSLHCYEQAMRLDPENPWVPYNMGLAFEAIGRMQEAREAYGKALSLNPEFTQALQRLRDLSNDPGKTAPLPPPPATIMVANSGDNQPRPLSQADVTGNAPQMASTQGKNPAPALAEKKPATPGKAGKEAGKAEPKSKTEKKPEPATPVLMARTIRGGIGAPFYNKAMDALEKEDLKAAVENYCACVLKDRDFLSEPDNGLEAKALEMLRDRPNSLSDGLFYRGLLTSVSGNLESSLPDLKAYVAKGNQTPFYLDAKDLIENLEQRIENSHAQADKASNSAMLASLAAILEKPASGTASFTARPQDVLVREMNVEDIVKEAQMF